MKSEIERYVEWIEWARKRPIGSEVNIDPVPNLYQIALELHSRIKVLEDKLLMSQKV